MTDSVEISSNRIQVVQNDKISFDTSRPSMMLMPPSTYINITDFNIVFPGLIQARAYMRDEPAGVSRCELWSTVFWQEWGPTRPYHNEQYYTTNPSGSVPGPTTRNLPRQLLGTIPADADFFYVRARLRRIKTPYSYLNLGPISPTFSLNSWITLPGGTCMVEAALLWKRMFNVVRIGNDIYLERFQSVANLNTSNTPAGTPQADLNTGDGWNSWTNILAGVSSYSDGTPPNQLRPYTNAMIYGLIDQRNAPDGQSKRPGTSGACNGPWPDIESIYQADFVIQPGIYQGST